MHLPKSKRLVFTLVPTIFLLFLLELCVRIFFADLVLEPVIPPQIGKYDATLGWAKIPNSIGYSARTDERVVYKINSHGFRDEETTHEKPKGTFRIALLGDSRTFGYGVNLDDHFSLMLERALSLIHI